MNKRKVAVYARVSTEHEAQISALGNQVQYYDNLFSSHPEWELYDKYIDEGITGTPTKKRKNFLRMMSDAEKGCFDLIVTREVSRFARNTVDTLQETRKLKKMGIEVYFTEDNIWTMNDEDGELRLTIMATLAQNESKKTSLREKAGQMVSFKNGIPYGNGNVLGYDRVGKEMVINKKQAKTVRMIYDLYLSGMGMRMICDELERQHRKTATGLDKWTPSAVARVLKNPFYSGVIEYRKEYVPDYLEQKKVLNHGEVDKIVVQGKHKPIVTKEEFDRVKSLLDAHKVKSKDNRGELGTNNTGGVWSKKLVCQCGRHFNKTKWSNKNSKTVRYAYQCYGQKQTGTVRTRLKKGLSIEGICNAPTIQDWKLQVMARTVFDILWSDKEGILRVADDILESCYRDNAESRLEDIARLDDEIAKEKRKLDALVDLRIEGEITKEDFSERQLAIKRDISSIESEITRLKTIPQMDGVDVREKMNTLKGALEEQLDFENQGIPDSFIDMFVDEIKVCEGNRCEWRLNLTDLAIGFTTEGSKKKPEIRLEIH